MAFADTNYMRITRIEESVWGTTPSTGNPTTLRTTGQSLNFEVEYIRSEEIRSDRMTADLVQVDAEATGGINVEMSYGNADDIMEGLLFSDWTETPKKENDGSPYAITAVTAGSPTSSITVDADGTNFKAGHLVKLAEFTNSANNDAWKVTASTGTSITVDGNLTSETPPDGAIVKVVGFEGAAADITASAGATNTLGSSSLDFTTLGLVAGMWIKIGGTATAEQFATTANNGWARIKTIAANTLTLDVVPSGWTTDNGSGKTIRVWFGDFMKNGTTKHFYTIERYHSDITQYLVFKGMYVSEATFNIATGAILTAEFMFMGKDSARDTSTAMPGTVQAAPTGDVMNSVRDVVSILENGTNAGTIQSLTMNVNNNLRGQKAVGTLGNAGIGIGDFEVSGDLTAYFEDGSIYDRYINDNDTSLSFIVVQDNQAYTFDIPRVKIESCQIEAGARNQDAVLSMTYRGILNSTYTAQLMMNKLYYYE